jgi:hypothetical protein
MVKQIVLLEVVGLGSYGLVSTHFFGCKHFYVNAIEFTTVTCGYKNAGPWMLLHRI